MPEKTTSKIAALCMMAFVCTLNACDSGKPAPHERLNRVERTLGSLKSGAVNNPSITILREFMAHADLPQAQRTRMTEFFGKQTPTDMLAQAMAALRQMPHVQTSEGDEIYQIEGLGELLVSGATDAPRLALSQPGNTDIVVLVIDTLKPAATMHVDLAKVIVAQKLSGQTPSGSAEGVLTLHLDLSPTSKPYMRLSTETGVHIEEGDAIVDLDATPTGVSAFPQANGEVAGVIELPAMHARKVGDIAQTRVTPRVHTFFRVQSDTTLGLSGLTLFGAVERTVGDTTQRLYLDGTHEIVVTQTPAADAASVQVAFETPGTMRYTEQVGQAEPREMRTATWSADTVLRFEGTPDSPETTRARKARGTVTVTTLGETKTLGPDDVWELGKENTLFQQLLHTPSN